MSSLRAARMTTRRRRSTFLVGASVLAMAVSGCSSPDLDGQSNPGEADPSDVISSVFEQLESMGVDADSLDDSADDDDSDDAEGAAPAGEQDPPPIKLWLPTEPTGDPAGWQRSPVQCEDRAEAIGSSYVGFAVPGEWELGGRSGGSGSPRSMSFDYSFGTPDVEKVKIAVDSDNRDGDGELLPAYDGQPDSESTFDYDYQVGDDTVRITFDSVGEIPVGEGTAELYVARPEQAPDRLKDVVYKARVNQLDLPQPTFDGGWNATPNSFVIEISYRPDEGAVPEDTIKSIISSLVMPDCSVTNTIVLTELNSQRDVDGDGHISDQQDFMDALQMGG